MPKNVPPSADPAVMACLGEIFHAEMVGIHRYLYYSFMIMGHHRIPIQKWLREQAAESLDHAVEIGEKITALGGHPPVLPHAVATTSARALDEILEESLEHEVAALDLYKKLARLAADDMALEELARSYVRTETQHVEDVRKMLRSPR